MRIKPLIFLAFFLIAGAVGAEPFGAPDKFWAINHPEDVRKIDHSAWQKFLDSHLVSQGEPAQTFVAYQRIGPADLTALKDYLIDLQGLAIRAYNRSEQIAYWINLYNAKTIELILTHYPVDSIRDITFSIFSIGPWGEKLLRVEDRMLSLNDIEHGILRPLWRDNRIHYAVNCASFGCPNLATQAYTAANTESLLNAGAVAYINHPRGVTINGTDARLSSIYKWYAADFGEDFTALKQHLSHYAKPSLALQLESVDDVSFDYDWNLNEAK